MLLKCDLDVQQTHLRGRFVEQKLMLSSSFSCYQILKWHRYDFGHTWLCLLSWPWMFNKPTSSMNPPKITFRLYLGSTVVEYSTHNTKLEGSNPCHCHLERENVIVVWMAALTLLLGFPVTSLLTCQYFLPLNIAQPQQGILIERDISVPLASSLSYLVLHQNLKNSN